MTFRQFLRIRNIHFNTVLDGTAQTLGTWVQRARTRRQLAHLDPALRGDIGSGNIEALAEAAKPFWRA